MTFRRDTRLSMLIYLAFTLVVNGHVSRLGRVSGLRRISHLQYKFGYSLVSSISILQLLLSNNTLVLNYYSIANAQQQQFTDFGFVKYMLYLIQIDFSHSYSIEYTLVLNRYCIETARVLRARRSSNSLTLVLLSIFKLILPLFRVMTFLVSQLSMMILKVAQMMYRRSQLVSLDKFHCFIILLFLLF